MRDGLYRSIRTTNDLADGEWHNVRLYFIGSHTHGEGERGRGPKQGDTKKHAICTGNVCLCVLFVFFPRIKSYSKWRFCVFTLSTDNSLHSYSVFGVVVAVVVVIWGTHLRINNNFALIQSVAF